MRFVAKWVSRVARAARGGQVEQTTGSPAEIASQLAVSGACRLYVDGGLTIQAFLCAGLIHWLILSRLPVLIGEGIPLFGSLPGDNRLRHIAHASIATAWSKATTIWPSFSLLFL